MGSVYHYVCGLEKIGCDQTGLAKVRLVSEGTDNSKLAKLTLASIVTIQQS